MRKHIAPLAGVLLATMLTFAALPMAGQTSSNQSLQSFLVAQQQPEPLDSLDRAAQFWSETDSFSANVIVASSFDGEEASTTRGQMWFAKPNNIRYHVVEASDGLAPGSTIVFDGNTLWTYDPGENEVTVIEGAPNVLFAGRAPTPLLSTAIQIVELPQFMMELPQHSTVRRVGETTINGRSVFVVEATPRTQTDQFGVYHFWIDRESGLPLRLDLSRPDGTVFFHLEFLEFDRDAQVPAEQFTFEPPEGATVRQANLEEMSVQLGWRDVTLEEARQETDFVVLTWAGEVLPEGMGLRFVRLGEADDRKTVALVYDRDGRDQTILMQNAAEFEIPDLPGAETVTIEGQPAQVLTVGDSTHITWTEAGTRVTMISALPREEAIDLAGQLGGPVEPATP